MNIFKKYTIIKYSIIKIVKYLIFLSFLVGIFFVIYRQSDNKGLRKWWISFKMSIIIAGILSGLLPGNAEAQSQSFNRFENTDQQVILVGRDSTGNPSHFPSNIGRPNQSPSSDKQNKAGFDELPDSSKFIYSLETKIAKNSLKKVWKNKAAKKEVLAGLDKIDKGKLLPRNEKELKGFKTLKEIKLKNTRMLVQRRKDGAPDQIVAIFMRRDMDSITRIFRSKYK